MIAQTKKHQTPRHTGNDEISIHIARKHSFEHPLYFEVHVQVSLGGHQVAWTMSMLPGTQVPIELGHDQGFVLIAVEEDLLLDSHGMKRAFPIHIQEEGDNETRDIG